MGATLYAAQQHALHHHFRSIVLMLDGDAAGRRATATMATQLRPYTTLRVMHLPDGVQPDQLASGAIREILGASQELGTIS
jgi:DNA primase